MIFSQTGLYEILLDGDLGYDDADFASCWVEYFDYTKSLKLPPRPTNQGRLPLSRGGGAVDVDSLGMTKKEKLSFRRAAQKSGAGVVDLGDHYHVVYPEPNMQPSRGPRGE